MAALPTLATNRLLGYAGSAMTTLFFAMFLFEFFDQNVATVLVWFLVSYIIRVPLHIIAAKFFSKTGLVPSMAFGTLAAVFYYASLYVLDTAVDFHPYLFLGLAIAGISLFNSFYWAPFHVDFTEFSSRNRLGFQLSLYYSAIRIIGVVSPIVGGFLIAEYGYGVTFLFGIFTLLLSFIPMVHLPETHVIYEFGFFESFAKLCSREYRPLTLSMMAHGAENVVGIIIWPIFLFTIFEGKYLEIGAFAGVLVVISLGLQMFVGRLIDKRRAENILSWGTKMYSLGWFFKALVGSVAGVFAASTFHSLGAIFMRAPMDAIYYEKAADCGHYVDEFTVIKETAITIGKIFMVIVLIGVTSWISLQSAFVVAAIVSLGMSIISRFHANRL
ncbi:hypothetical protein KJ758_01325 [Patescibacteria group bacterium]|nr:hypothetical protein [Patescibacteria group bacterium]